MMNYEVNPFQDYESITIDELKDQTNSLLNLVTEEQRPLRVFMNNGKEFLLFPQDLLAPICDSDFRLILLSAMRYAMGRNTCIPMVVADYIDSNPFVIELIQHKTVILVDTAVNVSCITNIPSFYSRSLCFIEFNCLDLIMNKRIEAMRGHFM